MARRRNKKNQQRSECTANSNVRSNNIPSVTAAAATTASDAPSAPDSRFSCVICCDVVQLPVLTQCGHLYCWPCIYRWLEPGMTLEERQAVVPNNLPTTPLPPRYLPPARRKCPVCKAPCSVTTVVPIFVEEGDDVEDRSPSNSTTRASSTPTGRQPANVVPPRPARAQSVIRVPSTLPTLPTTTTTTTTNVIRPTQESTVGLWSFVTHNSRAASEGATSYLAPIPPVSRVENRTTPPTPSLVVSGAVGQITPPVVESFFPFWASNPHAVPFGSMPDPFAPRVSLTTNSNWPSRRHSTNLVTNSSTAPVIANTTNSMFRFRSPFQPDPWLVTLSHRNTEDATPPRTTNQFGSYSSIRGVSRARVIASTRSTTIRSATSSTRLAPTLAPNLFGTGQLSVTNNSHGAVGIGVSSSHIAGFLQHGSPGIDSAMTPLPIRGSLGVSFSVNNSPPIASTARAGDRC